MHIDATNGSVSFECGSIGPGINKSEFLGSPLGKASKLSFINGAFETHRFEPESGVVATADFRDGRLLNLSMSLELPDDSPDNLSMSHELIRKDRHDEWLRQELGEPPYCYNWGEVVSAFYHQHCESDITVSYHSDHDS